MVEKLTNCMKSLPIFLFSCPPFLSLSLFLIISITHLPIISSTHPLIFSLTHFPIISNAWSATYYVDATNGNDANGGLSEVTPWKTIAKVEASTSNPGNQILLKKEKEG